MIYNPAPRTSHLETSRARCIGLMIPWQFQMAACNPNLIEFLEGIDLACHGMGMSMILLSPLQSKLRSTVARADVDGILALGMGLFKKVVSKGRNVPCVMVDSEPVPGIPCVNIDDEAGAYSAMKYVLDRGHRQIEILGIQSVYASYGLQSDSLVKRRMSGYLRALNEMGLSINHPQVTFTECKPTCEAGYEAFMTLWHAGRKPTAVVVMADIVAVGALGAARDLGIAIPADVSLVGYDDIALSLTTDPPLTTIRQPTVEKGRIAAQLLNDLIEGRSVRRESTLLPVELIERASVRSL